MNIFSTVLPSPQESLAFTASTAAAVTTNAAALSGGIHFISTAGSSEKYSSVETLETKQENREALINTFSLSSVDEFPSLGTVSSQNIGKDAFRTILPSKMTEPSVASSQLSTVHHSKDTFSSPWSTQKEVSGRSSTLALTPAESTNMSSQMVEVGVISSTKLTTDRLKNVTSSGRPEPTNSLQNTTIQTCEARKSSRVSAEPSINAFRKIPDGVFVVCDDFLHKNFKRAASISEKNKACKGCENRSKLKYAIWSDISKQWQVIRPYPAEKVPPNVAFSQCRQYAVNIPCLRTPCSFAHGEQELQMWTLEREGGMFNKLLV